MQRYRINYFLLFGLAAVTVVFGGLAVFVVHPWQMDRNAEWFRERAEAALAEDDLRTAFDYQAKYVRYRKDEDDARIKLANLAVDITKLSDATGMEYAKAHAILERAVLKTDDPDLRRKLAEMLIARRRPGDAIIHIDELLIKDPGNSELLALRVRTLFGTKDFLNAVKLAYRLIGYDKKSKTFDAEKATAADQPGIYSLLASTLSEVNKKPEQARRVIDQMIKMNPESYEAHLQRSIFLRGIGEAEEANLALNKAYELDPAGAAVLKLMGKVALSEKDYEKSRAYFSEGLKSHPESIEFFLLLAHVEMQQGNTSEALTLLDRGIKEFGPQRSIELLLYKIDALFIAGDFSAVNAEVKVLDKLKIASLEPLIAFQRTRIKWHNKRWTESVNEIKKVRPLLFQFQEAQTLAGIMLGRAYESLGQYDLASIAYDVVLQDHPNDSRALMGRRRVEAKIRPGTPDGRRGFSVIRLVREMLAQPESKQDWGKIDDVITEFVEKNNLPESAALLYRAQVFLSRKMFSNARDVIREASEIDPDNVNIRLAAVKLLWQEPESGPQKALEALSKVEENLGDSLQTRSLRVELLIAIGGENLPQQLRTLGNEVEDWEDSHKIQLYTTLGGKFLQLGQFDDSLHFWNQAVQLSPNNLPTRMQLFNVALQKRDNAAMLDAQKGILDLVHDKEDASYILTEVKRQIIGFGKNEISREELLGARNLLDKAMRQRPEWSDLHIVYGQLLLVLEQDIDVALQRLDDALKFGPPNFKAVSLQVQLLARQGLYQEASEKMELLPAALRSNLLGGIEAEILSKVGDSEEAFVAARKIAEQQPESEAIQKWYAKIAAAAGEIEEAESALLKALELNPSEPSNWSQLMSLYARNNKLSALKNLLLDAHLSLDAEYLPILTAKTYELLGSWESAEKIYLSIHGERINELQQSKRLAEFYLLWKSADPANAEKAKVYLNRILRASYEGNVLPGNMPKVAWARRQAAILLSSSGDYQKRQQALQLLVPGTNDVQLAPEDQILRGNILASLQDPTSQAQAIQAYSELRKNGQLNKQGVLTLAKLMDAAGDWQRSDNLMLDILATYPNDQEVRAAYVGLLIEHGDYETAQSRLNRMKKTTSSRGVRLQLLANLAAKKGDRATVRKTLGALLPGNISGKLDTDQLILVHNVARLAAEVDDIEVAEKLFAIYVKHVPADFFEFAQFHALYGDVGKALAIMQKTVSERPSQVITLASEMLRKRRAEVGDEYDEAINRLVAVALRDDPDSARRLLAQAEILEIQYKYDESIAAYGNLLQRDDIPIRVQAAAQNNLAFLLGLTEQRLDEAEMLVNQAIKFFGPIADLLDTRGVVRTASKQYDLAIEDLSLAVTTSRQPVTHYHLAKALMLAGDEKAAIKRWKEAQKLGLEKEKLYPLEHAAYDVLASKIQLF